MSNTTETRVHVLYRLIATAIDALKRCEERNNTEWVTRWRAQLDDIARSILPSGSGIDCGTTIDVDASRAECVVLNMSFHHMTEHGFYDGWTEHTIRVRPSLIHGITLTIGGRDRNDIKEYLHEVYSLVLTSQVEESADGALRLIYE